MDEANKQQEKMVLFDSITGAIYGPNTNGVTGYQEKPWWNPFASYGPLVSYHNGGVNPNTNMPNLPQQNILLTEVIALSPNDTPVFAKVRS